jgi:4-amino-4-deoxy-L-arabinose transferase-like glycosyltransferase
MSASPVRDATWTSWMVATSPSYRRAERASTQRWHVAGLVVVLLLAAFLDGFRLDEMGLGSGYYAAAVKSMLTSWQAFFFVALDPAGFLAVNKPPLGLWVQAASAELFGFSALSVLLPQALAGVLSVALLYALVRRAWGPLAALVAALVLACMPISVATSRHNTVDSLLVLVLLAAAWAVSRASETGRLRWLLAAAAAVGLGFNVKMAAAYLVLPAFGPLYLLAAPRPRRVRLVQLGTAAAVLVGVSLVWVAAVDLTPPDQRPYVGDSGDNTALGLAVGYNGLGHAGGGALSALLRQPGPQAWVSPQSSGAVVPVRAPETSEAGAPGPLRLLNRQIGGQIGWLLPLAVLGLLAAARPVRLRPVLDRRQQAVLLWAMWLVSQGVFFSLLQTFHRYYLVVLAPAVAAGVGIGLVALWQAYVRRLGRGWLLPLALVLDAAVEARLLTTSFEEAGWLALVVLGLGLAAAVALTVARLRRTASWDAWQRPAMVAGALGLLVLPLAWATTPTLGTWPDPDHPFAGPELLGQPSEDVANRVDPALVSYLLAQRGNARFLAASFDAAPVAPLILLTGQPVMALGGLSGGDRILTRDRLAQLTADGTLRLFLLPPDAAQRPELQPQAELVVWVSAHCERAPVSANGIEVRGPCTPATPAP